MPLDQDDREEIIYHGTTYDVALEIKSRGSFEPRDTYFSSTRKLAEFFARRSSDKKNGRHHPAVVSAKVYASDVKMWKANRWITSRGFSEGDNTELYGKTQLIFSPEAIRFLNRDMLSDELRVEQVTLAST